MSIVMFNRRLTGMTSPRWLIVHWTFFALLVIYTLCALFMTVFQCSPQHAHFDLIAAGKLNSPKKCLSENQVGISLSTIHVAMDFCLLSVPIIVLWKVQMPWSTKIRFFVVFAIGAMSCIGSVLRQLEQANLKTDILCDSPSPSLTTKKARNANGVFSTRQLCRPLQMGLSGFDLRSHRRQSSGIGRHHSPLSQGFLQDLLIPLVGHTRIIHDLRRRTEIEWWQHCGPSFDKR